MSDHPRPAMTVDVVARHAGRLLLIQRGNEPFAGRWALPGGFVDEGETVEAAAVRELEEETGLRVEEADLRLVGVFSAPGRDPRGWMISAAFAIDLPAEPQAVAGDDAAEAGMHPQADLPPLAFDHADIVARALDRALPRSSGP